MAHVSGAFAWRLREASRVSLAAGAPFVAIAGRRPRAVELQPSDHPTRRLDEA